MRRMYSEKQIAELVKNNPQAVVKALEGQDINVEGITSKGIANTGNIANTGDIATIGKITGGEIVENMSGYSYTTPVIKNLTYDPLYVGAVKNGNKLTIVIFGKVNRSGTVENNFFALGTFGIPQEIYDKLVATPLGNQQRAIYSGTVNFFSGPSSPSSKAFIIDKNPAEQDPAIEGYVYGVNTLTQDTDYQFRIELTFLLGENLVPED